MCIGVSRLLAVTKFSRSKLVACGMIVSNVAARQSTGVRFGVSLAVNLLVLAHFALRGTYSRATSTLGLSCPLGLMQDRAHTARVKDVRAFTHHRRRERKPSLPANRNIHQMQDFTGSGPQVHKRHSALLLSLERVLS